MSVRSEATIALAAPARSNPGPSPTAPAAPPDPDAPPHGRLATTSQGANLTVTQFGATQAAGSYSSPPGAPAS